MISKFDDLIRLFDEIDSKLSEKAEFFIIGGAMLLYHRMKPATKDIDVIVNAEKEFKSAESVLKKINFKAKALPSFGYENVNLSQIFIRDDLWTYISSTFHTFSSDTSS